VILVKPLRAVPVSLGSLRGDNPDERLDEEPYDDRQTHLAMRRDEMRSMMDVLVVDDGRDAEEEDGEGEGEVDELMLTESGMLLCAPRG
jgi:hypothetical protein